MKIAAVFRVWEIVMKKFMGLIFSVCLVLGVVLQGCGGDSLDNPINVPAGIDDMSISAVSYEDVATITLGLRNNDGTLTRLVNGDVVGSGVKNLCIDVSPRRNGERVFVSDGGTRITEAVLNRNGLYECRFAFSSREYNACPLLIQVLYENGLASKKKVVLATNTRFKAGRGRLVRHGMGVVIGEDLLAGMKKSVAALFSEALETQGIVVNEFAPADNSDPESGQEGVFYTDITVPASALLDVIPGMGENLAELSGPFLERITPTLKMDLGLNDMEDEVRGMFFTLEDLHFRRLPLPLSTRFSLPPVALDLRGILGSLNSADDFPANILAGIDLDKFLFVNVSGRPEDTTAAYAALGAGLYISEGRDVENSLHFPDVVEDKTHGKPELDPILPEGDFNMGMALSFYNLNQVLESVATGLIIPLEATSFPIPLAIPNRMPGTRQIIEVTPNPKGILVDLNPDGSVRMDIMDLQMEYIEGIDAKWQMSLDLVLKLGLDLRADARGGLSLAVTMQPVETRCHTHVMKDNIGIGIFDKSDFIMTMFKTLSGMTSGNGDKVQETAAISMEIPLDSYVKPRLDAETAGNITLDETGNCYMRFAADRIETGDLCFISHAAQW